MKLIRGEYLNELWGVGAAHALYIHDGHWYHQLKRFPGALFDRNGYVLFQNEDEYRQSPHLQIQKHIHVPGHISSMPGYVKVAPVPQQMAATVLGTEAFAPESVEDARRRVVQSIVQRQGQPEFRTRLLKAYAGKCCVTATDAVQALEAAHIVPYRGSATNHPSNGLLLRADLHSLFDQGLIAVEASTMTIIIAPQLRATVYATLAGAPLALPRRTSDRPNRKALEWHRREHNL